MTEDINRFRRHGDVWEAQLVEGYREILLDIIRNCDTRPTGRHEVPTTEGNTTP